MNGAVALSPVTRIEGHLAVHVETEPFERGAEPGHRVTEARCEGEMYRGFEVILRGRDPLDAQQITQRICGVCPISHGMASIKAQEMAYGVRPNNNGRILQNLVLAANTLQSHILHFYHLAALDFVDVKSVLSYAGRDKLIVSLRQWIKQSLDRGDVCPAAPFLPRLQGEYVPSQDDNMALIAHYVQALQMRRIAHEMAAIFGGKMPHATALVPGGCTQVPHMERVMAYKSRLKQVYRFIRDTYVPDVLCVAKHFPGYFDLGRGCGNFLCYGNFDLDDGEDKLIRPGALIDGRWESLAPQRIAEDLGHTWLSGRSGLHPSHGETQASAGKRGAYSWLKAPRYGGKVVEVGPLARVLVNYHDLSGTWIKTEIDKFLSATQIPAEKLVSVLGRHAARALESLWIAQRAFEWLDRIDIEAPAARDFSIPSSGSGVGLVEAPRGALGHWLTLRNHLIDRYQCVVPTTWNCSPRDDSGQPGPVEQALAGAVLDDPAQPIEIGRIIRSFDPCLACAVH